jgi:carbonic anhydrase
MFRLVLLPVLVDEPGCLPHSTFVMNPPMVFPSFTLLGLLTILCLSHLVLQPELARAETYDWTYGGITGPEHWGELSPEFKVCSSGEEQSPIDLSQPVKANPGAIVIDYQNVPLRIMNNGHTIQVNVDPGSTIILNNQTFTLKQFHFHHPSEHTVDGNQLPMELHLVHANDRGELAILGIFMVQGDPNPTLKPVWDAMPTQPSEEITVASATINLAALVPEQHAGFRYLGSLTTPPCAEAVQWVVLQSPLEVSTAQVAAFQALFPLNARPVQARNHRFLLQAS